MSAMTTDVRTEIFELRAALLSEASPKERRLMRRKLDTLVAGDPTQLERQRCLDVLAINERALGVLHIRLWNIINSGRSPLGPGGLQDLELVNCPPELRWYNGEGPSADPRD